ncbi:CRP/FNR family transcriptional regulator [Ciceribacter lividus]|uniref:CRP/FNR family transcriptional regulator n=1 Tax=Ciceribacter lividus TaxID=1197950 RepID=A0A6I7HQU4_9HYPH|nr:Crp/Fnr family transcriptional regulator [Ciceribacter lividus]RCW28221.1 CRP/FNR family transcriptional regulator [Ciceribacter lividus]
MAGWVDQAGFLSALEPEVRAQLGTLKPHYVPDRTTLFRPGDRAEVFLILLSGRIGVYMTGRNGRELLLYSVCPGETCVQTTLGVLGGAPYTGEAIAETDLVAVMMPPQMFDDLLATSAAFRGFVFRAFAGRLSELMLLLEQVAFVKVERRLAKSLLERAGPEGIVVATHQELAAMIGSAREVVSRRLEELSARGIVSSERGQIRIRDPVQLRRMASPD